MDKSVLKRAIEDTPDPTPGYMFSEISGWTYLDRSNQDKIIYILFDDKLATYKKKFCGSSTSSSSSGIHTVAKVLKVLKMVCETGHPDFQREVQQRVDEYIKCFSSQFRGANPDPKMGDRYNEKVRANAKEAIEAAYSSQKKVTSGNAITAGFGNDGGKDAKKDSGGWGFSNPLSSQSTGVSWGGSSSSTPNVGDQRIASMPTDNKWAAALQDKMAGVTAGDKAAADLATKARLGFGFFGSETVQKHSAGSQPQFASDNGGFQAVDVGLVGGHNTSGFRWGATAEPTGDAESGWGLPPVEERANLLGNEKPVVYMTPFEKVVDRIVSMKSAPQRVELASFLAECKAVHEGRAEGCPGPSPYGQLAEAIDKRLALKFPWGERLNVMTCLEHLLRNADMLLSDAEREQLVAAKKVAEAAEAAAAGDSKRAKKSVAMMSHLQYMQHLCSEGEEDAYSSASILAYFNENPEDVQRNIHVVQSSLKEKSKKVLAILGIPERVAGSSSTAAPGAAAVPAKDVEADFSGMVVRKRKGKASEEPVASAPVSMGGSTSSLPSSHQSPPATTVAPKGGMFKRKQIVEEAPTAPQQATPAPVASGWGDDAGAGWGSSEGFSGGWGDSAAPVQSSFTPEPPVVASPPPPPPQPVVPAVNDQQQKLMEVQQQFQALQVRMQTMMTSGNQTPEAMQALMTEQQNLMMTMMSLQK